MAHVRPRPPLSSFELKGRVEWMHFLVEAARREGRVISPAEHAIFERYVTGEIDGDEARQEILRLFETTGIG